MPGAASCQPTCVAQPPARFRSSQEGGKRQSAPQDAPVPLGLPKARTAPKSPRSASEGSRSQLDASAAGSSTPRASDTPISTNRCQVPAGSSTQQPKPLSITELVNQAARLEEELEAQARRGTCASPRVSSSRGASPRAAPFSPNSSSSRESRSRDIFNYSATGRPPVASSSRSSDHSSGLSTSSAAAAAARHAGITSASPRASTPRSASAFAAAAGLSVKPPAMGTSKPPLSPLATAAHRHSSASLFAPPSSVAAASGQQLLAAAAAGSPRAAPSAAATAASPRAMKQAAHHHQLPSSFAAASAAAAAAAAAACDCASDDGSLSPESSLCSSASNSSLCSYGSIASSSWSSSSCPPKSILMRRCHSTSSSSSGSCSPGGPKHVRWRDGESVSEDAGHDLVAVLLLHDTAEIRRLRKDTWPERSKGRDVSVSMPTISSSSSMAGADGAASNHPIVATVMDWKEKLRALSAERRAQRVAALQATWTAQQAAQQRQVQQQKEEAAAATATTCSAAAAAAPCDAAGGAESTDAVSGAQDTAAAAAAGGKLTSGVVISVQAVAGSAAAQACC